MARGFESKAVADQQESAAARRFSSPAGEENRVARLKGLELARADVQGRIARATAPAHLELLRRTLAALDAELAAQR